MKARIRCSNMNHGRSNAPVKFCPTCGDTVNRTIKAQCNGALHAALRRERNTFCVHCGKQLALL